MAKPITLKQARKILKKAGCVRLRSDKHETWRRTDGHTFALPHKQPSISAGIVRKLEYFAGGYDDYQGK